MFLRHKSDSCSGQEWDRAETEGLSGYAMLTLRAVRWLEFNRVPGEIVLRFEKVVFEDGEVSYHCAVYSAVED